MEKLYTEWVSVVLVCGGGARARALSNTTSTEFYVIGKRI